MPTPYDWLQLLRQGGGAGAPVSPLGGGPAPLPPVGGADVPQVSTPLPPQDGTRTWLPPSSGGSLSTTPPTGDIRQYGGISAPSTDRFSTPLPPAPAVGHSGPFGAMVSDYAKANGGVGQGGAPRVFGTPGSAPAAGIAPPAAGAPMTPAEGYKRKPPVGGDSGGTKPVGAVR